MRNRLNPAEKNNYCKLSRLETDTNWPLMPRNTHWPDVQTEYLLHSYYR